TSIINRMKGTLARLSIRNFNAKLKKAPERLEHVRTPEGGPIPPNTQAELRRDMERLRLVREQIRADRERSARASQAGAQGGSRRHGSPSGACHRDWHRDREHAGSEGAVAQYAGPARCSALGRAHGFP